MPARARARSLFLARLLSLPEGPKQRACGQRVIIDHEYDLAQLGRSANELPRDGQTVPECACVPRAPRTRSYEKAPLPGRAGFLRSVRRRASLFACARASDKNLAWLMNDARPICASSVSVVVKWLVFLARCCKIIDPAILSYSMRRQRWKTFSSIFPLLTVSIRIPCQRAHRA